MRICHYSDEHAAAVAAFNERLARGGSPMRFRPGDGNGDLPQVHQGLPRAAFLALDEASQVRGGYTLKYQEFKLGDGRATIADLQLPISEGCVDRRFTQVAAALMRDGSRREPLLYGLGMGGLNETVTRLFQAAGWSVFPVPFYFHALRPFRFLRNLVHFRRTALHRGVLDLFAFTGLGSAAIAALHYSRGRKARFDPAIEADVVDDFGPWADDIWQAGAVECKLCGVRDLAALRRLYPPRTPSLLKIRVSAGRPVGWALALNNQLDDHKHFGGMKLGAIVDCFAVPSYEAQVVHCVKRLLQSRGADLIISNQSHRRWRAALHETGFLSAISNFIFTASPTLAAQMDALQIQPDDVHINRGDGDGPINLD